MGKTNKIIFGSSTLRHGAMGQNNPSSHAATIHRMHRHDFINEQIGLDLNFPTKTAGLVHQNRVAVVDHNSDLFTPDTDGLITTSQELILFFCTQDCVPIFVRAIGGQVIGLVHGGWRNIVSGILLETFKVIKDHCGICPRDLLLTLGPHIQTCCFEVQSDVTSQFFPAYPSAVVNHAGKTYINLSHVLTLQAEECGVLCPNITVDPECTCCTRSSDGTFKYPSWRRDRVPNNHMGSFIIRL